VHSALHHLLHLRKGRFTSSGVGRICACSFLYRLLKPRPAKLSSENFNMSLETILIIVVIVFLLGGGGWYWQRGSG